MSNNYKLRGNTQRSRNSEERSSSFLLLPLVFVLAVIPLIVRMKSYNMNFSQFSWYSAADDTVDLFLYYKSFFFIITSLIIACILAYMVWIKRKEMKFSKIFIPLGGYALMAIISSLLSKYGYFSVHGISDQFESIFVLIGYCLVAYYAFVVVNTKDDIKFLMKWWIVGIVVMCLIGLSQFFGNDFYATDIGMGLIAPGVEQMRFTMEANRVYLSLYNPNYVGIYATLVIPIIFVLMLLSKKGKQQVGYGIVLLGVLLCVLGAQSKSALIALSFMALVAIAMFRKVLFQKWKIAVPVVVLIILAFVITSNKNDISFISRISTMFQQEKAVYNLTDIRLNNENVEIDYKGNTLIAYLGLGDDSNLNMILMSKDGQAVSNHFELDEETGTSIFVIDDERFAGIKAQVAVIEGSMGFTVDIDGKEWNFSDQTGESGYYYLNRVGKWDKIEKSESAVFTDYPQFATQRGYLWAKTLPIMKKNILIGSGADTYTVVFPQKDYVDNFNAGYGELFVTKPHNMYMQMGVQTGGISLVCFLVFTLWYIISSVRIYINCEYKQSLEFMGVGIMLAVIGYMIAGLSNDSTITCSGIFWVLIGIGISINRKIKESTDILKSKV